jgi:heme oxygenase (mycobilin-producing)
MIVVMNHLTVPAGAGERLERMFRERAGLSQAPGFIDFALLRDEGTAPQGGQERYAVVMRWADRAGYDAWVAGDEFARAHSGGNSRSPVQATLDIYSVVFEQHADA